jgi:UDP-perosamine 4-acetyltransferase
MKKAIIIGDGGHAKVIIDIIHEIGNIEIIGITSNMNYELNHRFCGYRILGKDDIFKNIDKNIYAVMGIGGYRDNTLRKRVFEYVKGLNITFLNIIHPSAVVSKSVKMGEGVVVFPGVVLNTEVIVGDDTIIATGATVDHESFIGNHVLISAGVTIGANCEISNSTLVALGAKVISGLRIGENSLIAAGAVVVKDIQNNSKVFGIPAKPVMK